MSASPARNHAQDDDFRGNARFEIVRRLGEGGMGVVYHAFDRERGVDVALKTLRRLDAAAIYHLKREFRALVHVRHRNLVRLHDLVSSDQSWFFTMELVDGEDFLQWTRRRVSRAPSETVDAPIEALDTPTNASDRPPRTSSGRISIRERVDFDRLRAVLVQLVEAVSALHAEGKLHRDLKPSNVLIERTGRLVLLDFGLATELRTEGDDLPLDASLMGIDSHVLGTPEYMSPEQAALRALGPASDWYSVGVMLFEALTGGLPFVGSPLEVIMAKERGEAPPPGSVYRDVPEDLDELCVDLLKRRPSDRPDATEILRRLAAADGGISAAIATRAGPAVASLLGREREMATFRDALDAVTRGRATCVQMSGQAGSGKSAILRRCVDETATGTTALVLTARCGERESVPFKAIDPLIDGLSRYLRRLTRAQLEAVAPHDLQLLARMFPVLHRVDTIDWSAHTLTPPGPSELRRRAIGALRELLGRIAGKRPLVLAIDDLQWADLDSVALLLDLMRAPSPPKLLLFVAFRSENQEASPALRMLEAMGGARSRATIRPAALFDLRASTTTIRRLQRDGCDVRHVSVGPLDRDSAIELAARRLTSIAAPDVRAIAETIAAEAAGSPALITELARYARSLEPSQAKGDGALIALDRAIGDRLALVPASRRRLLETIAVAGRPIAMRLLARAADVSDPRTELEALVEDHLIRVTPGADEELYETYHDRIRQGVLRGLSSDRVKGEHLAIARALELLTPDRSEALADHFAAAGARERASLHAGKAAEDAATALAFDRAARLYRRAIELGRADAPQTRAYRRRLGDALANAGRGVEASQEYLAAAGGADRDEVVELHRLAARQLLESGHIDEGLSVFELVLEAIDEDFPRTPRRALASLLLRRAQLRLRGLGHTPRAANEVSAANATRLDALWALTTGLAAVDTIRGADFHTRDLLGCLRYGDDRRLGRALAAEACFASLAGTSSFAHADRVLRVAREVSARVDDPQVEGLVVAAEGYRTFHGGEWRAALAQLDRSEAIFRDRCSGARWELANVHLFQLIALTYLGEARTLVRRLPTLLDEAEARGDRFAHTTLRGAASSVVWLVGDDPEGGRRDVADALARWSQRGFHLQHYYALIATAQCDLYAGAARAGLDRLDGLWPQLEASQLLRLQRLRIESRYTRARLLVATAIAETPTSPASRALLRRAAQDARAIASEAVAYAPPFAALIRASIASAEHARDASIDELREAVSRFDALEMALHARAAERALGTTIGGEDGERMRARSSLWMDEQEVGNPARLTSLLIPGFET